MAHSHHVGVSFHLVDLSPPSPAHLSSSPIDVLSKMSKSRVRRCLAKAHVSLSIKFGYSSLHLANKPPSRCIAMYASFLRDAQLYLPLPPLALSFLEFTGELTYSSTRFFSLFLSCFFIVEYPSSFLSSILFCRSRFVTTDSQ